jgi:hypothetical protein
MNTASGCYRQRLAAGILMMAVVLSAGGCQPRADDTSLEARVTDAEERFRPGLHSLMQQVQLRHAQLWFAGEAGNWELADYQVHELEELLEQIRDLHPEYDGRSVAELLEQLLQPAVERVESAIDARQPAAFAAAFDDMTAQCNACHTATDRRAIVIQRPTTRPLDNLRYEPQ